MLIASSVLLTPRLRSTAMALLLLLYCRHSRGDRVGLDVEHRSAPELTIDNATINTDATRIAGELGAGLSISGTRKHPRGDGSPAGGRPGPPNLLTPQWIARHGLTAGRGPETTDRSPAFPPNRSPRAPIEGIGRAPAFAGRYCRSSPRILGRFRRQPNGAMHGASGDGEKDGLGQASDLQCCSRSRQLH
jgi:hypothetical protein